MAKDLSHCARMLYEHDRDRFLLSLFAPAGGREALQAVYALNSELARIGGMVSEELVSHMRLAWWQERLEALYAGTPTQGHPVLEALQPVTPHVPKEMLIRLVEEYRGNIPSPAGEVVTPSLRAKRSNPVISTDSEQADRLDCFASLHFARNDAASDGCHSGPPPMGEGIIEAISLQLLRSLCPEAERGFCKAHGVIRKHRKRYGKRRRGWMSIKLLTGV